MSSGTLFQLVAIGDEDVYIHSEGSDASRPFRQVYKKQTSYATEFIDIDARFPTRITYGQTLSNIPIPRKGDLLRRIVLGLKVKRASGSTRFPALELIDEVNIYAGSMLLESIRGDYIFAKNQAETDAVRSCTERLTEFQADETQGSVKQFYVEIPFFTNKTPIPLIALQLQNLSLEIKLGNAPISLDPIYQPDVDILCEYIYVDDDERRYFTNRSHELLIERVQTQVDNFDMKKSNVTRIYTDTVDTMGGYDSVTGSGANETINLGSSIQLVDNPNWTGKTEITYNQAASTVKYDLEGRFLIPLTGSVGLGWAKYELGGVYRGYDLVVSCSSDLLTFTLKRDDATIVTIGNASISSGAYTTVSGVATSTDISAQTSVGEAWLVFDLFHNLDDDALTMDFTVEGYVAGGYFASLSPVNSQTFTYTVNEGYTPVSVDGILSDVTYFANASFDVHVVITKLTTSTVSYSPASNNYLELNSQLFFRGPVRYLLWWFRKARGWEFGKTSSDTVLSQSIRHDIMHSARTLVNGKERIPYRDAQFYSALEAKRVFGCGLPVGVHVFAFSDGAVDSIQPNGTLNFTRVSDVRLQQRIRAYSETQSNVILLDESESVPTSKDFDRVVTCAVGYNVVYIANGVLKLLYV